MVSKLSPKNSIINNKYSFVKNTYKRTVKSNPRDKIEVEIGDSKQPDYKPQAKIMRWNNDVNFSMRAMEHKDGVVETEGEKIKYITPDYEVHQYDKPEVSEDGGLEFEWVLKNKPKSNVLQATIQTQGLDFFKQLPLTQKQIDEGFEISDNLINSYAVYHKTKRGNIIGGNEYKIGKAFHINRPEAVDAIGNKTWCDLNIYEDKGMLEVVIPQVFLDKAVYPVVVDPTFGYTTIGTYSNDMSPKTFTGSIFTLSTGASVSSLTFYSKDTYTYGDVKMKACIHSSTGSILGTTNEVVRSQSFAVEWIQADFATNVELSAGDYYLSFLNENSNNKYYSE